MFIINMLPSYLSDSCDCIFHSTESNHSVDRWGSHCVNVLIVVVQLFNFFLENYSKFRSTLRTVFFVEFHLDLWSIQKSFFRLEILSFRPIFSDSGFTHFYFQFFISNEFVTHSWGTPVISYFSLFSKTISNINKF